MRGWPERLSSTRAAKADLPDGAESHAAPSDLPFSAYRGLAIVSTRRGQHATGRHGPLRSGLASATGMSDHRSG